MEDLGKYHTSLELPCNTTSLLTNMAGYHLLMFADFDHQDRFSYNLYNTLRRGMLKKTYKPYVYFYFTYVNRTHINRIL